MRHTRHSRWAAIVSGADRRATHSAPFTYAPVLSRSPETCGTGGTGGAVNGNAIEKYLPASAGTVGAALRAGEEQFVNH